MGQVERVGRLSLPLDVPLLDTLQREAIRRRATVTATALALLREACELLRAAEKGAGRN